MSRALIRFTGFPCRPGSHRGRSRKSPIDVGHELAQRAKSDAKARAELARVMLPMLERIARHHARRNNVDFRDAMQDGAIGLLEAVQRWRPDGGARFVPYAVPWIKVYASRTGLVRRKVAHRNLEVRDENSTYESLDAPLGDSDATWHEFLAGEQDAEAYLEQRDRLQRLRAGLRKLPKPQREAMLRCLQGEARCDVAADLGRSLEWMRQAMNSATAQLQTLFVEEEAA